MEPIESLLALMPGQAGPFDLNAGTLSPTPVPTSDAVAALRHIQANNPSHFFFHMTGPALSRARSALAAWLGVASADLFLFPNVTHALNLVMQSIDLSPGDEILTTNHEYGAMEILLKRTSARCGAALVVADVPLTEATPRIIVDALKAKLTRRTRITFFSHVASATGLRFPVEDIAAEVREAAPDCLIVVDGAHAPGMIPLNIADLNVDAYAANIHKWMMGPCSAGFLHVGPRVKHRLRPLLHSWGDNVEEHLRDADAAYQNELFTNASTPEYGATRLQHRLEYVGVYDRTPQMVLPSVIDFLNRVGPTRIESRWRELSAYTKDALARIGLRCASPTDCQLTSAMPVFALPDDPQLTQRLWERHGILIPQTNLGRRRLLRVSTAWFNTHQQIDDACRALKAERFTSD
jgi:isopenicillin-N epimerase